MACINGVKRIFVEIEKGKDRNWMKSLYRNPKKFTERLSPF